MYICGVMKGKDYISIRIKGSCDGIDLSPSNYSIEHLKSVIDNVLKVSKAINNKDVITMSTENGSVWHKFYLSKQQVLVFGVMLLLVNGNETFIDVEKETAEIFESIQEDSRSNGYIYEISTSMQPNALVISPKTNYRRINNVMVDTELYLYGVVTKAGGKGSAKMYLDTEEYGNVAIETSKETLENLEDNLLYHTCGVYVTCKMGLQSCDICDVKAIEILDYTPSYDEAYLNACIERATPQWEGVTDALEWLNEIRGAV